MWLYLYLVSCQRTGCRVGGTHWALLVERCSELATRNACDMFECAFDSDLDVQCVGIAEPQHAEGDVLLRVHESRW